MVDITKTVGDQGNNASEDVALIQLMLRVAKNAKGQSYFANNYNGTYDQALKAAIVAFQQDQKLIPATPATGAKQPPPPVLGSNEKPGLVGPDSKTLSALIAKLPADLKQINIIPGTKTIYVEGKETQAMSSATLIRANPQLNDEFREKVALLVESMYKNHKISLDVEPGNGWRRDFAQQIAIANANGSATGAGPGESPHQFGRAVDIGFKNFKWVAGDGTINNDNYWLSARGLSYAKQVELWNARNEIAFKDLGLYKTNKPGDFIHVQGFSDDKVSWGASLAKLLETASPTKAKWSPAGRAAGKNTYKVDIGLGAPINVGSSTEMWNGVSPISKTDLAKTLNAKITADPTFSVEKFFGIKTVATPAANQKADAKPTPLKEADIKADYIKYIQTLVKTEIQAADKSWDDWKAVK